jgi:hypothetical protein
MKAETAVKMLAAGLTLPENVLLNTIDAARASRIHNTVGTIDEARKQNSPFVV